MEMNTNMRSRKNGARKGVYPFPVLAGIIALAVLVLAPSAGSAQSGTQDPTFGVGTGPNNRVFAMAAQADGRQIIGGSFTTYNGTARNRVARIQRNGSLDASFAIGSGANGQVNTVLVTPDGKVLIGGSFGAYNSTTRNRLARLNSNGSLDAGFAIGPGFAGGNVTSLAIRSDGRILVAGTFTQFNGASVGRIVCLNTDGTLDATYAPGTGANGDIYAAAIDQWGRTVIGGGFTSVNGVARPGLARLNANGTLDATFNPGAGPNSAVYCIAHQRDGKVLIGGLFTSYNGSTPAPRIARLNRNGSYDSTFSPGTGFNSWVYTIVLQGDGKLLVGGDFTTFNGASRNRFVRLQANGSVDSGFSTGSTCNNWVYAITWQPEGRVTVAGGFTNFNGTTRNRLVRLFTGCDENIQLTLRTDAFASQTSWELIGEGYTYTVCSGTGFANNSDVTVSCCVPMGCLRLRVLDSAGDGMASGGYVLKDQAGRRVIDNTNDGVFGSVSSIAANGSFCLPMSADRPIMTACDKLDFIPADFMIASPVAEVSAQWGVGDQTDDGYEFWFYDPDGSYSHRRFRNHATAGGFGVGALRACYQRLSWSPSVDPIPIGVLLNVKIRGRVNGVNNEWGPACRFKVDPVAAACPQTKLVDLVGNPNFSCGVTRTRSQHVTARGVTGANTYEFEFVNTADGYSYSSRSTTFHRTLNWSSPALVPGRTYQVRVRASRDSGVSFCPWGDVCTVTIAPAVAPEGGGSSMVLNTDPMELALWPNPNTGKNLEVNLTGVDANANNAQVIVVDATGKLVHQQQIALDGPQWRTSIDFGNELPQGQYILRLVSGDRVATQRFLVVR